MKRFAMLGLTILLVGVTLAMGCGGDGGEEAEPTATPTQVAEQPGELPDTYTYTMELSDSQGNSGEMTCWVKGDKWRTDLSGTWSGYETEAKFIYDGEYAYMYTPDGNQVMKFASDLDLSNLGAQYAEEWKDGYYGDVSEATMLAGFQAGCMGGASIDGHETVAGYSCTKFTCNAGGGVVSHTWITEDGWAIKIEVTENGNTRTLEFTDVNLSPSIPDSTFDIDSVAPGATIFDMTGT
jgi:outer membrane lipoprotein-sorting protein